MLLQQSPHATGEPCHNAVFPAHGLPDVDARTVHMDAQRAVTHEGARLVESVGRVNHGLGGDAAHVEARAPELLAFNQRGGNAQLRGAYSRDVAARAAADDQESCVLYVHVCLLHKQRGRTFQVATYPLYKLRRVHAVHHAVVET